MRSLALVGVAFGVLAVTAAVSPLLTGVLVDVGWKVSLPRVYDRTFQILLGIALALAWRSLDLGGGGASGLHDPQWRRRLGQGVLLGTIGITAGLAFAWWWGGIVPALRFAPSKTVWKAALGFLGAVLVGVGEEVLFRGILLRRFVGDLGVGAGVGLTTGVYAVVHALRTRSDRDLTGPWGGVERTLGLFAPVGEPSAWPSMAGLAVLGLLLAWARLRTGSVWLAVGIHASWVAVFRVGRLFFAIRRWPAWLVGPGWPPLIGGMAGAVALVVTGLLLRRVLRRSGTVGAPATASSN